MVGAQVMMAFILTAVQGWGPALSLTPAIDRAAGMLGAICMLFVVNLLFGPVRPPKTSTAFSEEKAAKRLFYQGLGRDTANAHGPE